MPGAEDEDASVLAGSSKAFLLATSNAPIHSVSSCRTLDYRDSNCDQQQQRAYLLTLRLEDDALVLGLDLETKASFFLKSWSDAAKENTGPVAFLDTSGPSLNQPAKNSILDEKPTT